MPDMCFNLSLLKRVEEKIGRTIGQLEKNDLDILKLKTKYQLSEKKYCFIWKIKT
jgi:hypothetical protein